MLSCASISHALSNFLFAKVIFKLLDLFIRHLDFITMALKSFTYFIPFLSYAHINNHDQYAGILIFPDKILNTKLYLSAHALSILDVPAAPRPEFDQKLAELTSSPGGYYLIQG